MSNTATLEADQLCLVSDLASTGAKSVERSGGQEGLLIVRSGDEIRAYVSRCPHLGVALEFMPDHVLDDSKEFLVCSAHGARFQVEDGLCVRGPCRDDSLESVKVKVEDGAVLLAEKPKNPFIID